MNAKRAEQTIATINELSETPLSLNEKEVSVLGQVLNSEPMVKALALIRKTAISASIELLQADFENPSERRKATVLQGWSHGLIQATELLFKMGTEKEEEEEDERTE